MKSLLFCAIACSVLACEAVVKINIQPGDDLSAIVKRLRAMSPLEKADGVEVLFAPGDYFVNATLNLSDLSGVSPARPIVFRAAVPNTVRILGGKIIPTCSFAPETDPAVLAKLPTGARVFSANPESLAVAYKPIIFMGGRIGKSACWPNAGFTSFSNAVDVGVKVGDNKYRNGAFIYDNPRAQRWDFTQGVKMCGYWTHDWAFDSAIAKSFGPENGTNNIIRLGCDIPYGICKEKTSGGKSVRRFKVYDLLEELDVPGEYFYDLQKKRLYVAVGEALVAGLGEIVATGTWHDGVLLTAKNLQNVLFRDLAFAYRTAGLVSVTSSENVTFEACSFYATHNGALTLNGVGLTARACTIQDIGGIGIGITGGDRSTLARSNNLVENCRIRRYAQTQRTYRAAVDVRGVGITVRGCTISEAPHVAIRYSGNDHVFEYNDVSRVLLETGDAGAFYCGRNWTNQGVVHRYNYFHDIGSPGMSVIAIYFDDCESGACVYGNVFKCSRGVLVGGGRDHPIRNNIFIGCKRAILLDNRGRCWRNFITPPPKSSMDMVWHLNQSAWKSEVWQKRYPRLAQILDDGFAFDPVYNDISGNLFVNCTEEAVHLEGLRDKLATALANTELSNNWVVATCGQCTPGIDPIIARGFTLVTNCADVGFADAAKGDYRLRADGAFASKLPELHALPLARILRLGTYADSQAAPATNAFDACLIKANFASPAGPVKPVNGVGQPPILGWNNFSMFKYLKDAGIPYSRLHDVGGAFGKGIYVDIPNIFRAFDANEDDPQSYDFAFTDQLLSALVANGVEPYFRLGVTIENQHRVRAYRISPPKDYAKWARICEHIIRHYTEGWANGYRMKISHWEIWNEPENQATIAENCMWHAPFPEYVKMYILTAKHLKTTFPHLKIGGYASCGLYAISSSWGKPDDVRVKFLHDCFTNFVAEVKAANAPLDFFSFHCYDRPPHLAAQCDYVRKTLDAAGFTATEMSLNEWMTLSQFEMKGTAQQASEIAAMLTIMQNGPVDDAEIYDAQVTSSPYAPLFNPETRKPRRAYYVYLQFNELRKLGKAVPCEIHAPGVWACAAASADQGAVLIANTNPHEVPFVTAFGSWQLAPMCRLIDESHLDTLLPVPKALPPYSVLLLKVNR